VVRARGADADAAARLATEVTQAFIAESRAMNAVVTTSGAFRERIQVLGPTVRVISDALRPQGKDGPRALLLIILAPLLGALSGLGVAAGMALLSRCIWSAEQLQQRTGGEFFGYVPGTHVRKPAGSPRRWLPGHAERTDLPATLRRIRAAALERRRNRPRIVGLTSAVGDSDGDTSTDAATDTGKTIVAKGLALLLANSGQRVLLVDAAFATRQLSRTLQLETERGLSDVLHRPELASATIRKSLEANLDLMGAGLVDAAHGAGDVDARWPALARALSGLPERSYDWVILDLSPLDPPSAIRAAGVVIDDILLVVRHGAVRGTELDGQLSALGAARGKLLGAVFSTVPTGGWLRHLSATWRRWRAKAVPG
jgi:Mrp family chromosome partitioning ATPase